MTKKIVVTGIGATSPLGGTAPDSWDALLAGESGAHTLEHDWVAELRASRHLRRRGEGSPRGGPRAPRDQAPRPVEPVRPHLRAARRGRTPAAPDVDPERLGVDYSTGIGGLWTLLDAWDTLREKGPRRVLPMTVPMLMPNGRGRRDQHGDPVARATPAPTSSACASSTESIANAYDHLQHGLADVVIAGGTEAVIHPLPIASFASMQALSKRNDDPATASRPYDVTRDGFVLGEGAATIVLETEEHALARGARIYAELAGGAVTSDSYHITAPDPEGSAAARAMIAALELAGATLDRRHAHQRARHEHPGRRHRRVQRHAARVRRSPAEHRRSRPRRRPPATCSAARARSRRSSRSSRCTTAPRRRRSTSPSRTRRSRSTS